jgi:hypothetical protein
MQLVKNTAVVVASTRPVTTLQEPNKIISSVQLEDVMMPSNIKLIGEDPNKAKDSGHTEREGQEDRPCIR